MKRLTLIANPHAGRGRAAGIIEEATRLLSARGIAFDLEKTSGPNDAERLAAAALRQGDASAVIAVGGDGTLNEIIQTMLFQDVPIGVIPAGSGNDFCKMLNMPDRLDGIVDVIAAGRTKVIDAGRMNTRYFINNVGIGFDAAVNFHTREVKWPKSGLAVYFAAFLRTLTRYRPLPMKVGIGGETIEQALFLISIGNGTTCGGGFKLTPHAKIDDGLLDVTMVTPLGLPKLMWHLPKVFLGTIDRTRYAQTRRAASLTITSPHPLPMHIDGEVYALEGDTCVISVLPKALRVIGNFTDEEE